MDRESIEQVLDLTDAEKTQLATFVANNALEHNKYYRYEYYRDNCSTRIRDALNLVLSGSLERRFVPITTPWTYRSESIRLTAGTQYSQLGIDLALGPKADLPISAWEAMFVPMRLRDYLRDVTRPAPDGGTLPLVQEERVLHTVQARRPEPTESRGLVLGALGPVLGAWMLMLVPIAPVSRRTRRIPAAVMAAAFYGITGLLGFKNTLATIRAGSYEQAAAMMLQSRWATQVGRRAERLSRMMATGKVPPELGKS
jgi:hypothetical protein